MPRQIGDNVLEGIAREQQITMSGSGKVVVEERPTLGQGKIGDKGKPTPVDQGAFTGYSLPIHAIHGKRNKSRDEEIFAECCVPDRWDGASNIAVHVYCYLALAEDSKKFKLQLSWAHYDPDTNELVPAMTTDVEVETDTGANAPQYKSFNVEFTLVYGDMIAIEQLGMRLRRIDASADECAGEIVIQHLGLVFDRDKVGIAA